MTQRNKKFFDKFLYDCSEGETENFVEFNIGYVPFIIERISDGELLYLNKDNKSYSFKNIKTNSEYSWARLFLDPRARGSFRAIGWCKVENLKSMHKTYKK